MADKNYFKGRNEGMVVAYKIALEEGVEALLEDIKWRGLSSCDISSAINKKAYDEMEYNIAMRTIDTVLILAITTLRDEFDFGKVRAERFMRRFLMKTECLADPELTDLKWSDLEEYLKEELGLELHIREWKKKVDGRV